MDKLLIPATFTIHAAEKQKDSRYVAATINLVFEGIYFGKYLFARSTVDDAAPSIANISIMSEDGDCAVGVITESNGYAWGLVMDNGRWRNYLQLDCLFWRKQIRMQLFPLTTAARRLPLKWNSALRATQRTIHIQSSHLRWRECAYYQVP